MVKVNTLISDKDVAINLNPISFVKAFGHTIFKAVGTVFKKIVTTIKAIFEKIFKDKSSEQENTVPTTQPNVNIPEKKPVITQISDVKANTVNIDTKDTETEGLQSDEEKTSLTVSSDRGFTLSKCLPQSTEGKFALGATILLVLGAVVKYFSTGTRHQWSMQNVKLPKFLTDKQKPGTCLVPKIPATPYLIAPHGTCPVPLPAKYANMTSPPPFVNITPSFEAPANITPPVASVDTPENLTIVGNNDSAVEASESFFNININDYVSYVPWIMSAYAIGNMLLKPEYAWPSIAPNIASALGMIIKAQDFENYNISELDQNSPGISHIVNIQKTFFSPTVGLFISPIILPVVNLLISKYKISSLKNKLIDESDTSQASLDHNQQINVLCESREVQFQNSCSNIKKSLLVSTVSSLASIAVSTLSSSYQLSNQVMGSVMVLASIVSTLETDNRDKLAKAVGLVFTVTNGFFMLNIASQQNSLNFLISMGIANTLNFAVKKIIT